MDRLETVQKVCSITKVTYEEAKEALEKCDWDALNAIEMLEKEGKFNANNNEYSTKNEESTKKDENKSEVKDKFVKTGGIIRNFINRLNKINFVISRNDNEIIALPILVMVLLVIISFWPVLILLIIGLFANMRYSIKGASFDNSVNNAFDKASDVADDLKTHHKNHHTN